MTDGDPSGIVVIDADDPDAPELAIVEGGGSARALVWPGTGAEHRSLHLIRLDGGARTIELEHPMEAVYYVVSGAGSLRGRAGAPAGDLVVGSMIHAAPGAAYAVEAGDAGLEMVGGPCPPDPRLYDDPRACSGTSGIAVESSGSGLQILHRDEPDILMPMIAKDARLIVWPGRGAETAPLNYVDMQPGEANVPHEHPISEDTLFVLDGEGTVEDITHGRRLRFHGRQIVHVPVGVRHCVHADLGSRIESVGGPAPVDRAILRAVGALDEE